MTSNFDLTCYEIRVPRVLRNPSPGQLYDEAVMLGDAVITSSGALTANSGAKTGRSPKDKRIVDHPDSCRDVWWGDVNIRFEERNLLINRQRAIDYLNVCDVLYVIDGYAGWDPKYRVKVRVICARAYHALFMHNMLIRPTDDELENFGEPDYVIYNAGRFPANRYSPQMTSPTSVAVSFERGEIVILGTQYAGEMKKGVFTVMNYLMPKRGVLSMHCSANEGNDGDVSLFFGLSGTGKTTLSADPARRLIGDDEHCWTDEGIFNIEGGCYAKCINLSASGEPQIYEAIKFGAILENVVYDPRTRVVDYADASLTENTRVSYPIEFIPHAKIPCIGHQPRNIILLTCDAFGVLPPVSKLSRAQLMYHFLSGYTAKIAGTEQGVTEPQATFSACFGAAFLVWHPMKYAHLLADRMQRHGAQAWLVNTGWSGGAAGTGKRIKLNYTRAIIDAIHNGTLTDVETTSDPIFGLEVPTAVPGVPSEILSPRNTWADPAAFDAMSHKLAGLFRENFSKYDDQATKEVRAAEPKVSAPRAQAAAT